MNLDGLSHGNDPPVPGGIVPAHRSPDGKTTLVGGLPWSVSPPPPAGADSAARPDAPVWTAAADHDDPDSSEAVVEPLRMRIDRWVRMSPPFTLSLAFHAVLLLILAMWVVRDVRERRVRLELEFASPHAVALPQPGIEEVEVTLVEPDPVPEPMVVKTEAPPVEAAIAAPPPIPEPVADTNGAEVSPERPPVVGMLLDGREEGRREPLLRTFGGSDVTESAVARALAWLVKQQDRQDGQWSLRGPYVNGGSQENRLAATAMALLALQGAGHTPAEGRYATAVDRGWKGLLARQLPDGSFDVTPLPSHHSLYAHAQATIALCELYGMTHDPAFRKPAERAVAYAVAAQGPNGGWRYGPGQMGDMSVTGWFLMALKSAEMAGLDVPARAFESLGAFVDTVAVAEGTRYGYRHDPPTMAATANPLAPPIEYRPGPVTAAVSAEGLLARQFLGWPRQDRRLGAGVELLLAPPLMDFDRAKDVYAWYYITQVVHHLGGEPWIRWNDRMKEVLPAMQITRGSEAGSWDPALDKWGSAGGRLFMTCFCTYMLEVYYRHLPLYGHGSQ
jgi:hypothetical protein